MTAVRALLWIGALSLNAWLVRLRLDSFIISALCALPLLRVRTALDEHRQVKVVDATVAPSKQYVLQIIVRATLVCVMVKLTSFGDSPLLTLFAACMAALQICSSFTYVETFCYRRMCAILDRWPDHSRRVMTAGLILTVVCVVAGIGLICIALALYNEWWLISRNVGFSTCEERWPGSEQKLTSAFETLHIKSRLVQDFIKAMLSSEPLGDYEKLKTPTWDFLVSVTAEPLRIVGQSLPLLYYTLVADEHPWWMFEKICSKLGIQNFAKNVMNTLESILICCLKRAAIYGMLAFCVAVFAGLPCPVMFATLSASQGLIPLFPPEGLYAIVAIWIGLVDDRIFMMLLLLGVAGASAWLTLWSIHSEIPFQNRFYMGLCVLIGIQTFGPLGMILGPFIGALPVLILLEDPPSTTLLQHSPEKVPTTFKKGMETAAGEKACFLCGRHWDGESETRESGHK